MYDFDLSVKFANKIHAVPKNCYWNARTAFLRYKQLRGGWYIEGYALVTFNSSTVKLPFEHAWIELKDGSIVDPTYAAQGDKNVVHIPGIKLNYEEFTAWRKEKKEFPFFYNFGFGGSKHSGFTDARKKAYIAFGL